MAGSTQQMALTAPGHRQRSATSCMLLLLLLLVAQLPHLLHWGPEQEAECRSRPTAHLSAAPAAGKQGETQSALRARLLGWQTATKCNASPVSSVGNHPHLDCEIVGDGIQNELDLILSGLQLRQGTAQAGRHSRTAEGRSARWPMHPAPPPACTHSTSQQATQRQQSILLDCTWGRMVMSVEESVVPAMVCSSQGSMNTTRPSLVLGTIMPTAGCDAVGGRGSDRSSCVVSSSWPFMRADNARQHAFAAGLVSLHAHLLPASSSLAG